MNEGSRKRGKQRRRPGYSREAVDKTSFMPSFVDKVSRGQRGFTQRKKRERGSRKG